MPYSAKKVRHLREKLGWNQTELAFRAGVGATIISNFENYKRQTPGMAKKIARALKVKVDELWVEEDEGQPPPKWAKKRDLGKRELAGSKR